MQPNHTNTKKCEWLVGVWPLARRRQASAATSALLARVSVAGLEKWGSRSLDLLLLYKLWGLFQTKTLAPLSADTGPWHSNAKRPLFPSSPTFLLLQPNSCRFFMRSTFFSLVKRNNSVQTSLSLSNKFISQLRQRHRAENKWGRCCCVGNCRLFLHSAVGPILIIVHCSSTKYFQNFQQKNNYIVTVFSVPSKTIYISFSFTLSGLSSSEWRGAVVKFLTVDS